MDNCGPHAAEISDPLGHLQTIALPPNCTSVHQPVDQGIIQALKKRYCFKLLHIILDNVENNAELCQASRRMLQATAGLSEGREAHLLNAMKILHKVWNDMETSAIARYMETSAIARCCSKSAILPVTMMLMSKPSMEPLLNAAYQMDYKPPQLILLML